MLLLSSRPLFCFYAYTSTVATSPTYALQVHAQALLTFSSIPLVLAHSKSLPSPNCRESRKLTSYRSILCKRDRFDMLPLVINAQNAQGTSNGTGPTSGYTALTGME